ncbi:hypothetical protein QCA50_008284 [Cerrena zonata]|uniref:Uncharacterized protein n=1 Tax=Cerrena zonata TaxID=2478898 RepID=A0AAW0GC65_9APHY
MFRLDTRFSSLFGKEPPCLSSILELLFSQAGTNALQTTNPGYTTVYSSQICTIKTPYADVFGAYQKRWVHLSVIGPSVDCHATQLVVPSKHFTSSFTFQYITATTAEADDENVQD